MIGKIIIALASAVTIVASSVGIYSARELVTRNPICHWEMLEGFSGLNYADTYVLLLFGVAVGVGLMTTLNSIILTEGN